MSLAGKQRMKLGQIKMMMSIIQSKVKFFFCIRATKVDKKFLENRMNQDVRKYVTLKIENRPFFLKRICEFWDQPTSKSDSSIQIDENISQKECRLWPNRIFFSKENHFYDLGLLPFSDDVWAFFRISEGNLILQIVVLAKRPLHVFGQFRPFEKKFF